MEKKSIALPLYVSTSNSLKGIRCIKASRNIKKGELLESCPIIIVPGSEYKHLSLTVLGNYEFVWNDKDEVIVLGYGSLYNHSFAANATYERNFKSKRMEFYAIQDIKKDEEIFINYNGKHNDETPLEHTSHIDFKY